MVSAIKNPETPTAILETRTSDPSFRETMEVYEYDEGFLAMGDTLKVLITMMGLSTWGLFNSIWANIRKHHFVPDRVYLLKREDDNRLECTRGMIMALMEEYSPECEFVTVTIRGDDVYEVRNRVREIAMRERGEGNEVALDVTPGRKGVVLGAIFAGWDKHLFDHLFYLYIESLRNASRPFLLIPLSVQHPHDIISEGR